MNERTCIALRVRGKENVTQQSSSLLLHAFLLLLSRRTTCTYIWTGKSVSIVLLLYEESHPGPVVGRLAVQKYHEA